MQPLCFFVSWQGVLTLAYRGFCPTLCALKANIEALNLGLPKENPGSKWPKTSLGCLKDNKRLTPDDLQKLNEICRSCSMKLEDAGNTVVRAAAVVLYSCRSLERVISWHEVAFSATASKVGPSEEEISRVQAVVAEADAPDYWISASKDGNREQHYRGGFIGATLACKPELEDINNPKVSGWDMVLPWSCLGVIRQFQKKVDADLPGMYVWFSEESLHMTLRALT
ncbi:hypothetical protein WJX73_008260 [Symbiochloris irregularis]|uniref:Uncharacterized protein n=1 Tax=Symbiochloris irregularis TaxID=706552 RepID=A0AAW1PYZ1_9CHLO